MATDATDSKHDMLLEVTEPKGSERRRQGKFQPFRRLFGKKKKREAKGEFHGAELKASFSTGEVCNGVVSDDEESNQNLRELNPVGSRALSHDSIFIPEEPASEAGLDHSMSQENVSDKVRNLQRQIAQGIKFGQRPPSLRKSEGDEGSSDEEEVPPSPLRVLAQVENEPTSMETKQVQGAQHAEPHSTPVKSPRSKRVLPPTGTIESINLDAVPQSVPRLDNTAAKHKLSVKPKNQRVSRKHRRFTQDLQEVSISGILEEDLETPGVSSEEQRRASVESVETLKKQRLHEEEMQEMRRRRELEEQRMKREEEEEERRKRAAEEQRLRELEEERRLREEEERRQREEEERRQREEEERMRREEERRQWEEEERRQLEEQRMREEEEKRRREEEEEVRRQMERKRKQREEEEERKRKEEAEKLRLQEIEEKKKQEAEERRRKEEEEQRRLLMEEADKRRAEELRWKEMEERQPFSFKVSSGEKQILFQKVNLTPVTPASSQHGGATAEQREGTRASSSSEGTDSPNLPTSPYVPHTAILVTGAQLCGTAVNLDQIKDTACKSLLGLGEDRKAQGAPTTKSKTSPDRKSSKTKSLNESSLTTDQSGAAVLAEWASIRSKIFRGVEEGKYEEYEPTKQPSTEEPPEFSHTNLRKTMSASAKFSITPAKKKFGDSSRNSEVLGAEDAPEEPAPSGASPPPTASRPQSKTSKTVRIVERGSEECVFAKDLPSFLVPTHGAKPEGLDLKSRAKSETEACEAEDDGQDGEDKPSPFGIKLRRTNYSLRFHSEQSTEKRKKRYSAGDRFDGVPSPLTPIDPDSDSSSVFSERSSPTSPLTEGAVSKFSHTSASPAIPRGKPTKSTSPAAQSDAEKVMSKPPIYRRPTTSPKPVPTPPPSPLPKVSPGPHGDILNQRMGASESPSPDPVRSNEAAATTRISPVQGDEEQKEKKSFFPSINIPWREKTDRKTELIRREKPSLQSRHSLDSARVQEKEAGPLWITLALQKQKGFREQQQNREDRRSQREAKLAEKHTRDSVPLLSPTESRSGSTSPSSKPQTPEEPKRPESLLGRFERREQLKKANTLPSSVTVEIADSTPSPPAVKEVSKRFPSTDSPQVSTEPAWLALAKRKAKAWSDCPQIIK